MHMRNVRLGLRARTRVLNVLEKLSGDAKTLGKEAGTSYQVTVYHLKLLETRGIVNRKGGRPFVWKLTGLGQKRLVNSQRGHLQGM
jgi:hypothetical protein